jgi:hypothetical protein
MDRQQSYENDRKRNLLARTLDPSRLRETASGYCPASDVSIAESANRLLIGKTDGAFSAAHTVGAHNRSVKERVKKISN